MKSSEMILAALASWGIGSLPMQRVHVRDSLAGVDIEKEYALIQQKKSQLSASKRREVVGRMENS